MTQPHDTGFRLSSQDLQRLSPHTTKQNRPGRLGIHSGRQRDRESMTESLLAHGRLCTALQWLTCVSSALPCPRPFLRTVGVFGRIADRQNCVACRGVIQHCSSSGALAAGVASSFPSCVQCLPCTSLQGKARRGRDDSTVGCRKKTLGGVVVFVGLLLPRSTRPSLLHRSFHLLYLESLHCGSKSLGV